jgi:hypothetical protein
VLCSDAAAALGGGQLRLFAGLILRKTSCLSLPEAGLTGLLDQSREAKHIHDIAPTQTQAPETGHISRQTPLNVLLAAPGARESTGHDGMIQPGCLTSQRPEDRLH